LPGEPFTPPAGSRIFYRKNWQSASGEIKHEISINPDTLGMGDVFWHSTLVHEMVHMWQFEFGSPSRYNYHNKEWALKMMEIGLMPTSTGKPGGKPIGQNMDHYVMEGRGFQQAFNSISDQELLNLRLPYINTASMRLMDTAANEGVGEADPKEAEAEPAESKSGKKVKYSCGCGVNVWGKSGLNLHCNSCDTDFEEQ
jgi:predicted SprT family Zn-dependent metalloprotease